jgi:hypothetical protein
MAASVRAANRDPGVANWAPSLTSTTDLNTVQQPKLRETGQMGQRLLAVGKGVKHYLLI